MTGSEVLSALTSAGIPLLFKGSPESIIFAAGVQPMLAKGFDAIISDIFSKKLTKRELARLGISYQAAIWKIEENVKKGISIRNDDFFVNSEYNYSKADDILESILKESINDTEQNKSEFYGYFYANLAFCPEVDYANALHFTTIISQLSYTHLCLIKYLNTNTRLDANKWKDKIDYSSDIKGMAIYHGFKELVRLDLTMQLPPISVGEEIGTIGLNCVGKTLYKIMDLDKISPEKLYEVSNIIDRIKSQPPRAKGIY